MNISAVLLAVLAWSAHAVAQSPRPTALVIYAVDPVAGTAVTLSGGEVYVDVWGHGETYRIKPEGNAVRIALHPGWQCSVDPAWCDGRFTFDARITIRAEGYETVTSDHFPWLETGRDETRIQFPAGRTASIRTGATAVVTLPLRRPAARRLRILDRAGAPVTDANVTIRGLLARTNHCGFPEGEELFDGKPAADGSVPLPAGEQEFSVAVWKRHYRTNPKARHGWIDARFDAPESVITLEPMERRPLLLELRNADGTPADAHVIGNWADGCMFSGVPIGRTDGKGRVTVEEFYPEEFSDIGVQGAGGWTWLFDPRREKWSGRRVIHLKP